MLLVSQQIFVNLVKGLLVSSNAMLPFQLLTPLKPCSDLSRNMMLSSKEFWHQINIRIVIGIIHLWCLGRIFYTLCKWQVQETVIWQCKWHRLRDEEGCSDSKKAIFDTVQQIAFKEVDENVDRLIKLYWEHLNNEDLVVEKEYFREDL